jgi:hypothetical protein
MKDLTNIPTPITNSLSQKLVCAGNITPSWRHAYADMLENAQKLERERAVLLEIYPILRRRITHSELSHDCQKDADACEECKLLNKFDRAVTLIESNSAEEQK